MTNVNVCRKYVGIVFLLDHLGKKREKDDIHGIALPKKKR